jgi:diadenosine tetraphosphate (Ap4A) HIT family hydrolase
MFDPGSPPSSDSNCPFCAIAAKHTPFDPLYPPASLPANLTTPESFVVLSTPHLVAFLDILPLSRGHLLLCTRAHRPKVSDVNRREASQLGEHVRLLSKALVRATGVPDWNVVQNNGAAAAQVVPHMHFHLIPRPDIRARGRTRESFTMFGRGTREELDDDEAEVLAAEIRKQIAAVLEEEAQMPATESRRPSSSKL